MPLTRSFKETIRARVQKDPAFRNELLREGIECLLYGDLDAGRAILRDYINATIGFERLGSRTRIPAKSLMRMFSPKGNPRAANLLAVIAYLQKADGLRIQLRPSGNGKAKASR